MRTLTFTGSLRRQLFGSNIFNSRLCEDTVAKIWELHSIWGTFLPQASASLLEVQGKHEVITTVHAKPQLLNPKPYTITQMAQRQLRCSSKVNIYIYIYRSFHKTAGRPTNQLKCNGSVRGASWIKGARRIGSGQGRMGSHESDQ